MAKLLIFLFLVRLSSAQACPPENVIVDVLNARGLPAANLPASSFKASSSGKRLTVLSASLRSDPATRTYVLLDMAESMGGVGAQGIEKWKIARGAAADFLNIAPPQAEISFSTFSDAVEKTSHGKDELQAIQDWLNNPESMRASGLKGKAAIYRAIVESAEAMEPARTGDSILVITDGRNDKNLSTPASVANELASRGIRLFSFVLDDSRPADSGIAAGGISASAPTPNPAAKELSELVKWSGGLGYTLHPGGSKVGQAFGASYSYDQRTQQNVRASVAEIGLMISNFYILTVSQPGDSHGLEDFQLEVVDAQGKKRKDVMLTYPVRIPGCQAGPSH